MHENRNISAVLQNIYALNQVCFSIPEFKGPYLEPRIGSGILTSNKSKREGKTQPSKNTSPGSNYFSSAPELKYISNPYEPKTIRKKILLDKASLDELVQTINNRVLQDKIPLNLNQSIVQHSGLWSRFLKNLASKNKNSLTKKENLLFFFFKFIEIGSLFYFLYNYNMKK